MDRYDAIVVGAGPVGGYLSRRLNEHGHSVLLVEEHAEIGRPFQCAGLVNPAAMDKVNMGRSVLSRIWGANIHSPHGVTVSIGDPTRNRTNSVCRKIFDEGVVSQSIATGTDLILSSTAVSADVHNDMVEVQIDTPDGEITVQAKLLCGADGAHSWVRRHFKMGRPKEMMIGFQIEVTGYDGDAGRLDMYTGSNIAPGFFSWAIPSGETTRVGTWTTPELMNGNSSEDFLNVLISNNQINHRFADCREVGRYCGPVPSGIVSKVSIPRVILFGDAAGICKPTTGGGIGPGFDQVDMIVPKISKNIASNSLGQNQANSVNSLMADMKRRQRRKKALRDAFLTEMSDDELEDVFSVWARPEVIALINDVGEIENPIPLGIKMLKEVPEFRRLATRAAKAILWG
ncbi:MAG: geranylgeranyl reductase family protein [Candidatus Thalassarchaeum sp.]|nr:geranylgeranyl reductase family protein [Candidatus Thalassarchaeum sp.]